MLTALLLLRTARPRGGALDLLSPKPRREVLTQGFVFDAGDCWPQGGRAGGGMSLRRAPPFWRIPSFPRWARLSGFDPPTLLCFGWVGAGQERGWRQVLAFWGRGSAGRTCAPGPQWGRSGRWRSCRGCAESQGSVGPGPAPLPCLGTDLPGEPSRPAAPPSPPAWAPQLRESPGGPGLR